MTRHRIIIDTDPGVDDALAILLANYSPDIELLGLTTIFGNVSVDTATQNAGYLVSLMQEPVPVARGAERPLVHPLRGYPTFVHGENGFGDVTVQIPPDFRAHELSAAQFIVQQVRAAPGEITLVPIGPLTNIALALALAPDIAFKVKRVVLMGGAVYHRGNVTPVAEANIWNDAHAAQAVFAAPWPVTMVGLDVTHQTIMPESRMAAIRARSPRIGGFLADICRFYANFYRNTVGFDGFSMHDPATIVQVLHPEYFSTQKGQVDVLCEGRGLGQTIFAPKDFAWAEPHWADRDNVDVCLGVDGPAVLACFEQVICRAP